MTGKLTAERRWYLSRYARQAGWRIDLKDGVAKWRHHRDQLVKAGLLEQSGEGSAAMFRITPAGIEALEGGE